MEDNDLLMRYMAKNKKRFYRSRKERIIAGVCGGLADYLDTDPSIMRLIVVLLAIFTGIIPFTLIYLILWVVVPEQP